MPLNIRDDEVVRFARTGLGVQFPPDVLMADGTPLFELEILVDREDVDRCGSIHHDQKYTPDAGCEFRSSTPPMTESLRPITSRRLARMRGTLARRQPDLAIVIENVHDPHNVSAMLRSCDAVGVATAHLVYTREEFPELSTGVAASAQRWMDLARHDTIADCYATLRQHGLTIYATSLRGSSRELYDVDLTLPTAFVFGNESLGVTDDAIAGADDTVYIPMMGMVESLNASVACSVALYEALRQRQAAGCYASPRWPEEEIEQRLRAWLLREGRDPSAASVAPDVDSSVPRARNRYDRSRSEGS